MDRGRVELKESHSTRDAGVAYGSDHELATRRAHPHLVTGLDAELRHRVRGETQLLGPGQWRERLG